jgi:chemotaxis protein CheX
MRVEYINPFIASLHHTFQTMLDCETQRGAPYLRTDGKADHCVSGVIGLSGLAVGTVVLNLSKEVALKAASAMLMMEMTELDADVIDAVGELTNVVAGAAKAKLEEYHLSVSLPNVVTGQAHGIHFPSNVTPICVPFTTPWGAMVLEVGLTPVPVPETVDA